MAGRNKTGIQNGFQSVGKTGKTRKRLKVIRLKHCADWENLQFALRQKNG
jgi:hypothetical protein